MQLLLIRHGRPHPLQAAPGTGADPGLTTHGHEQADLLGHHLAATRPPAVVYTSPMLRARETAAGILRHSPVPLHTDERLREFDHGAPGYTPPETDTSPAEVRRAMWRALETGVWGEHTFDPDAFARQVAAAFADIVAAHPSETVAVVCHSGVLNSYLGAVLSRPRGMFFQPDYTSVSRVVASPGRCQLISLNETTHLQLDPRVAQFAEREGRR